MTSTLQQKTQSCADTLREAIPALDHPVALVQLGSTFSAVGILEKTLGQIPMTEWPGFGESPSPSSLPLVLTLGLCGGKQVLVAEGHRYVYEGLGMDTVVLPTCVAHACGVRNVILVEPGLSLRADLKAGAWLMATDLTSSFGTSPLHGNTAMLDQPFPSMVEAFSQRLNSELMNALAQTGLNPKLGVVHGCPGPEIDGPAQVAVHQARGADVMTMGVVPDVTMGTALGCHVSALLLAGGHAPGYWQRATTYEDMKEAADFYAEKLSRGLRLALAELD